MSGHIFVRSASNQALLDAIPESGAVAVSATRRVITYDYDEQEVEEVRVANRRFHTHNVTYVEGGPYLNARYPAERWERIVQGLQAKQLRTQGMICDRFQYLLPSKDDSRRQRDVHRTLETSPMIVSPEDLREVLKLTTNDHTSPYTSTGHHFYIRSWTFTPGELDTVIDYLESADLTFEEVDEWRKILTIHSPEAGTETPRTVTVRYLGSVQGPRRPIDRWVEDLTARRSGVLHEFLQAVDCLFPVFENGLVELIEDASLEPYVSPAMRDDVERVLIEYFQHSTLLNRQDGGFYTSYLPTDTLAELWRSADIQFYHRLCEDAGTTSMSMRGHVVDHFRQLQQYANGNPHETGTVIHHFGDALRDVMTRQAMPYMYRKELVPLIVVGKDITLKDYLAESSFWSGRGQASSLVADFLRRIVRNEAMAMGKEKVWNDAAFDHGAFPFVDLWCWLWHQNLTDAVKFLITYFRIVRPLISVTFSRPVNDILTADFETTRTSDYKISLTDLTGTPTIQYYDRDEHGKFDPDSAFINIPHIHPGRDKYSSKNIELRTVMDFSWKTVFVLGQIALDCVDKYLDEELEPPSRLDLCNEILEEFAKMKRKSNKFRDFFNAFDEAKDSLKDRFALTHRNRRSNKSPSQRPVSDLESTWARHVLPVMDPEARVRLADLGVAEGQPYSKERLQQLERLWIDNVPELHMIHPNTASNDWRKQQWINDFSGLALGQFMFLHAARTLEKETFMHAIIRVLQPDWSVEDNWFTGVDGVLAPVELHCGLWLKRPRVEDRERTRTDRKFPDAYATAYDLQGRNIGIARTNGRIAVHWQRDDGVCVIVNLYLKYGIPTEGEEYASRALNFTPAGIDIVNSAGEPYRIRVNKDVEATASITKEALPATQDGKDAMELWKAVLEAHGISRNTIEDDIGEARQWGEAGVAYVSRSARGEQPRQNRPLREEDGLYPLEVFLRKRFPEGGVFRTAPKTRLANSTADLQAFVAFLKTPEFVKHPFSAQWRGALERSPPAVATLASNLKLLRSCEASRHKIYSAMLAHLKKKDREVTEMWYHLGLPGTGPLSRPYVAPPPRLKKITAKAKKQQDKNADSDDDESGDSCQDAGDSKVKGGTWGRKVAHARSSTAKGPQPEQDSEDEDPPSKKQMKRSGLKRRFALGGGSGIPAQYDPATPATAPLGSIKKSRRAVDDDDEDDKFVAETESVPKKKKKRARVVEEDEDEGEGEAAAETEPPKKKKRGRPPKVED